MQLTPAGISLLAGCGIDAVKVFVNPRVAIITTGKELVTPGNELPSGKIYESNSYGLAAALLQMNIAPAARIRTDDIESEIINAVSGLHDIDMILITGGVSVGEYDLVTGALEKCNVTTLFHRVKQKPGKPFLFGKRGATLVFALPGNPGSAFTCFYKYVVPAIGSFNQKNLIREKNLKLGSDFKKKTGLTFFLKGKTSGSEVNILDHQDSYLMNSFAEADCLIEMDEQRDSFLKGEVVKVSMIN